MRPSFRVIANGSNITQLIEDRLLSLSITDEAGFESDRATIELDDRDQRLEIPEVGALLKLSIGYDTQLVEMGDFTVDEVEVNGPVRSMTIRASAAGFTGSIAAPVEKSWHETTLGDIAKTIAGKHNLTASVHPEMASIEIKHADQNESDIQFLTRLALENGGTAKIASSRLILTKRAPTESADGKELPKVDIAADETTDWSSTKTSRGDYTGVKAYYHDTATATRIGVLAGDEKKVMSLTQTYQDQDAAKRAAEAKLKALKNGKGTFRISSMPGNPYISAELRLNAVGFRDGVDGEWVVLRVEQRLSSSGYTTSVECETPDGDG